MRAPGGINVEEAIARASQRVGEARERCIAGLDEKIEEIARATAGSEAASMQSVYCVASEIYALAGTFGLKELSQAASSLCDLLVAALPEPKGVDQVLIQSVTVHVDALRTLRGGDLSDDRGAREAVVEGLRRVSEKTKAALNDRSL
jgi:hypothetical protein